MPTALFRVVPVSTVSPEQGAVWPDPSPPLPPTTKSTLINSAFPAARVTLSVAAVMAAQTSAANPPQYLCPAVCRFDGKYFMMVTNGFVPGC